MELTTVLQLMVILGSAPWWWPILRGFIRDVEEATRPEERQTVKRPSRGSTRVKEFQRGEHEVRQRLVNARWDTGEKRSAVARHVRAGTTRRTWRGGFGRRGL